MEAQTIAVDKLTLYHRNARRGNIDAIAESLSENGQYKPIVVNLGTRTGRSMEVLAGNHTLQAAKSLGWSQIDVVTVDVDEAEAARIVLADNRTSDLGGYDTEALSDMLHELDDLAGTGYDADDLEQLDAALYEHTDGPRDLDALHAEVGDPTERDSLEVVKLVLPVDLARRLEKYVGEDHEERILELVGSAA